MIPYIPDRLEEGYGLNREAVDAPPGARGGPHRHGGLRHHRRGGGGLRRLSGVGLVYHHRPPRVQGRPAPAAVAVVDPHRADCPYPFKCLAGVGWPSSWRWPWAPGPAGRVLSDYADLAAIGTVADVMSLTGENRAIVRLGPGGPGRTGRPGLRALIREAGGWMKSP